MLKVKLTFRTLDLEKTLASKKEEYKVETQNALVASTKSYNNLIDDLKAENKVATNSEIKELFLDKATTEKAIAAMVAANVADTAYQPLVTAHIIKALDAACVFKKPAIVRKKA